MNQTIEILKNRKSVRAYQDVQIPEPEKALILEAAMRAPTAGNLMLYSILDITDAAVKGRLAVTCDNQPFIARAPMVLLFLADHQRWHDYFVYSDVSGYCREQKAEMRKPEEGDLLLACCDALISAQTAVVAAESLGIGSCYIGDIMENYEAHRELFNLPDLVFPISLVCFGYPTEQQKQRRSPDRFPKEYIVYENKYRRLKDADFDSMFQNAGGMGYGDRGKDNKGKNIGQRVYDKKVSAEYAIEMNRSVKEMLKNWKSF